MIEYDLDLACLLKASVVISAAHVLGECFHICGFFAVQSGLANTDLFICFGNTKDSCVQLASSSSEVSAHLVGIVELVGIACLAGVAHKDDHIVIFSNLELVTNNALVLLGEQGVENDAIVAVYSDGVDRSFQNELLAVVGEFLFDHYLQGVQTGLNAEAGELAVKVNQPQYRQCKQRPCQLHR